MKNGLKIRVIRNGMENTSSPMEVDHQEVPEVAPKRTYHRRAPWRYNEDGTYNKKPIDPDYFKRYYEAKTKGVRVKCECGGVCLKSGLERHRWSKSCFKYYINKCLVLGEQYSDMQYTVLTD